MTKTTGTVVLLAFCILLALPARSDTITYVLTQSNLGSGYAGPFASVTIGWSGDDPSNTATVRFESLMDGQYIYLMGDGKSVALNVSGDWAIDGCQDGGNSPPDCAAIAGANSFAGFTPGPYTLLGAGSVDGYGDFDLRVKSFDGFTHSATEIVFTLTNTTGTWANAAAVLTPNAQGEVAAIHAFACVNSPDPCDIASGAVVTGYASGAVLVPEPATALLLGTAVVGIRLRRRQRFVTRT